MSLCAVSIAKVSGGGLLFLDLPFEGTGLRGCLESDDAGVPVLE